MDSATASAESLRKQVSAIEDELKQLRAQLASVEAQDAAVKGIAGLDLSAGGLVTVKKMIMPSVGIQGKSISLT